VDSAAAGVPAPVTTISQAVIVDGGAPQLWIAGQLGCDESGRVVAVGDPALQAAAAFESIGRLLNAAGATWSDLAVLRGYATSLEALMAIRKVRERYLVEPRPISTMVVVKELGGTDLPDFEVEIEAMAVLPVGGA
jgi:2-iminobutanoate/2-iminopropanoate deaminase